MKIAYFYLTPQGEQTARKLKKLIGGDIIPKEAWKSAVSKAFDSYDGLVFVMACGIVVRRIAPLLKNKKEDPAVVVMDQAGRFAISLLSGHLGGANQLARRIASLTGAQAVITTATDIQGVCAFDEAAKNWDAKIENLPYLKEISAALLKNEEIDFITDLHVAGELGPNVCRIKGYRGRKSVVFDIGKQIEASNVLYIRPRCVYIGTGCKKGVSYENYKKSFLDFLNKEHISLLSVKGLATIEKKKNEPCILSLCRELGISLTVFSPERLKTVEPVNPSDFVKTVTGVWGVSESCALKASGNTRLLAEKTKYQGITFAAAMEEKSYEYHIGQCEL